MTMRAKYFAAIIMVCLMTSVAYSDRPDNAKPATLLPALVWNPHSIPAGDSLYETLIRGEFEATITNDIALFVDSLLDYHLFIMAGIYEHGESLLTESEYWAFRPALAAFLAAGGACYWEGAGTYLGGEGIYQYFGAYPEAFRTSLYYLRGREGGPFDDIDSMAYGPPGWTYMISGTCPPDPYVFLGEGGGDKAVKCENGLTRTMLTNFSWARLNDSGLDTRVELAHCVMNWLSGAVAVEEPEPLPSVFSLSPPYPNPFNAQVTIEYALPNEAAVSLSVFDIQGRKVATLTEGMKPAGYHRMIWDAKGMPSGLYFVRLKAGEFTETKKMTLVK
jgi:hypothetical protein